MGIGAESESLPLRQRIWLLQTLWWRKRAKALVDTLGNFIVGTVGMVIVTLLTLFMIGYPLFQFQQAWKQGILLISVPLLGMLIAGIFSFRLLLNCERLGR
jgi:ABC-type glycerol-3-phosphate transport system permease component